MAIGWLAHFSQSWRLKLLVRSLTWWWHGTGGEGSLLHGREQSLHGRRDEGRQGSFHSPNFHAHYRITSPRPETIAAMLGICEHSVHNTAVFGLLLLNSLIEFYLYNIKFTQLKYTIQLYLVTLPSAAISVNQFQDIFLSIDNKITCVYINPYFQPQLQATSSLFLVLYFAYS